MSNNIQNRNNQDEEINKMLDMMISTWDFIYDDYKLANGKLNYGKIIEKDKKDKVINLLKKKGVLGIHVIITKILKNLNFHTKYKDSEFVFIYLNHVFENVNSFSNGWEMSTEIYRNTLSKFLKNNYVYMTNEIEKIIHKNYFSRTNLRNQYRIRKLLDNPNEEIFKKTTNLMVIHRSNYDYINSREITENNLKKYCTIIIVDYRSIIIYCHKPVYYQYNDYNSILSAIKNINYKDYFHEEEKILIKGFNKETTGLISYHVGEFRCYIGAIPRELNTNVYSEFMSKLNGISSRLLITLEVNRFRSLEMVHEIRMKITVILYNINMLNKVPHKVDEKPIHSFWQNDNYSFIDIKDSRYNKDDNPDPITNDEFMKKFRS